MRSYTRFRNRALDPLERFRGAVKKIIALKRVEKKSQTIFTNGINVQKTKQKHSTPLRYKKASSMEEQLVEKAARRLTQKMIELED